MALTQATKTELYRFFVIAFDAAPGTTYMSQLAEASESGMSVQEIVEVFTTKPQFTAVYPNFLTNEQFANKLVANVVGDSASAEAKAEAEADVAAALNAGWSRGEVIYTIFNNLAAKDPADPVWGATSQQMANQVAVAQYYTEEGVAGNDTTDLATLQAVIAGVDQNTDVSTPEAIEAAIAAGMPAVLHVLTDGIDSIVGGAGADEILGGTMTLGLGDYVDGGDGDDVMNLTLAGDGGEAGEGLYAGFDVENVETINLRSIGYDNEVWVSMTGVEGLETLNIVRSTNETTVEDIQNMVDVNLDDVSDDVGIYFDWNEIETRELDLSVKEVGSSAGGGVDLDIDGEVEVLNIDDRGVDTKESNFDLYAQGADQIVVTGGEGYTQEEGVQQAHLSLDWIDTNGGTTLDSTAYAGDLRAETTQWDVDTIDTGAGDDQLMIYSDWDNGNTIDTNDGDDSVTIYGEDYGYDDATVNGSITTGNGDDTVHVYSDYGYYGYYGESAVGETGLIDTGAGDDYVYLDGGIDGDGADADDVPGQVLLGSGNDHLYVQGEDYYGYDDGDVNGLVDAGEGDDLVELHNSTVGDTGVLMGGEGNDELQLWNSNYDYPTVVNAAATITGVETLSLGNTDYDDDDLDHQIDLDAFDEALATINIVNASSASGYADQEVTLTNLTTEAIRITSTDSDDGDDVELDVSLKDGSGEEDVLSVELFGGSATAPAKFEVDLNDSSDDSNIESLALANNGFGNREVDTSQDFDVSLTVTGDSEDDLRVHNSTSQLVDATAYAGDFTIEVATEQDYEILTGSGDDVINLVDDVFTNGDTLDGGAGNDRLVVDESTQTVDTEEDEAFDNVNNIETLEVLGEDEGTLYVTFDDDVDRAGIAHLIVSGQDNDDDGVAEEAANVALTIGADYELALTVDHTNGSLDIDNDGAADIDVNLDANGGRTLTFTDASNGGEINLTVQIADGGVDTLIDNAQPGAGTDGSVLLTVAAGAIDSITLLDSVDDGSASDNGAVEIIIDDMWTNGSLDPLEEMPAIGSLTIDASDILDDDTDSTTGGVFIDGILETNTELTLTGSANDDVLWGGEQDDVIVGGDGDDFLEGFLGADALSGGAGNDTLWGDDSTGTFVFDPEDEAHLAMNFNDTIDGGAGDDIITGGYGKDLLTGGAGNDTFLYDVALESNGTRTDTITDFNANGDDVLSFLDTLLVGGEIKYLGEVDFTEQAYTAMSGAGLAPSGVAEAVLVLEHNLLYVDLNNDGFINDGDITIALTGVTDLEQVDFAVHTA